MGSRARRRHSQAPSAPARGGSEQVSERHQGGAVPKHIIAESKLQIDLSAQIRHNAPLLLRLRRPSLPLLLLRPHPQDPRHRNPHPLRLLRPRLRPLLARPLAHRLAPARRLRHPAPGRPPRRSALGRQRARPRGPPGRRGGWHRSRVGCTAERGESGCAGRGGLGGDHGGGWAQKGRARTR